MTVKESPHISRRERVQKLFLGALGISICIHAAGLLLLGGWVLVEKVVPRTPFEAVEPSLTGMDEDAQVAPEPEEMQMPGSTDDLLSELNRESASEGEGMTGEAMDLITASTPNSLFTLPSTPGAVAISPRSLGGGGVGQTMGSGRGSGPVGPGRKSTSFFGIKSESEAIGFFLDFSGSMSGGRKEKMLAEFKKSLHELPDGFPVMIILWQGPAWNLEDDATNYERFWSRQLVHTYTLDVQKNPPPPQYIQLNSSNRARIIEQLGRVKNRGGATDARSPFRYAMMAPRFPDVVYLMTDGQFWDEVPFRQEITKMLGRLKEPKPVVHVVALGSSGTILEEMTKLSKSFDGKVVVVE